MLSLNEHCTNKELYYYNIVEQGIIDLEELSNINASYSSNYLRCFVDIEQQRQFIETEENFLEEVKKNFIKYAKAMCDAYIDLGTDIKLNDENVYHFSLSIEDQQNIKNAVDFANLTQSSVPYHADGELCKMFSVQDINKIYAESIMYITYQTTYFNMLKHYIQNCNDAETIIKSYYLMELPEEYSNKLNEIISQSRDVVSTAGLQEDIPQEIKPEDNLDENTSENISDENTQEDIPKQKDIPNEEPIEEYIQENESNENELQEGDVNEQA